MNNYQLLSNILGQPWMLNKEWASANLPLVAALLQGQSVEFPVQPSALLPDDLPESYHERYLNRPRVIDISSGKIEAKFFTTFNEAPANSLALIPVIGPISQYYSCDIPGSNDMTRWTKEAEASPNIVGIVFLFNTPGGMVFGTRTFAEMIWSCSKPTVAFVDDGMSASAGYYASSACDRIFLSQPTDSVGSIGTLTTLMDYSEYFKKNGIKIHEIYAEQSTEKNRDYREAIQGKYERIQAKVSTYAQQFIDDVQRYRGGAIDIAAGDPFKGEMYFAEQAIQIGLADRVGSLEEAIADVYSRVGEAKNRNLTNKSNMAFFSNKYPGIQAVKGKAASDITEAEIKAINSELDAEGVTGIRAFPSSFESDAEALQAENNGVPALKAELASAQKELASLKGSLEAANTALTAEQSAHSLTKTELSNLKNETTAPAKNKPAVGSDPETKSAKDDEDFTSETDVAVLTARAAAGIK